MISIPVEDTHVALIEDGVPLNAQTMTIEKPFWLCLTGGLGLPTWLMGVLIAAIGFNLTAGIAIIIVGNLVGAIVPSLTSIMGPRSRLTQIESSRLALGRIGKILPAFLNWASSVGWDALVNIPSTIALITLLDILKFPAPFWAGLTFLVVIQMIVGVYGHHLVQLIAKYVGYLLLISFVVVGIVAMRHAAPGTALVKDIGIKEFVLGLLLTVGGITSSWSTYTADYTRYLPQMTKPRIIFRQVFSGLFLSNCLLQVFGFLTASAIAEQTPDGVLHGITILNGPIFGPLFLLIVALVSIPVNAINDNSAAYCLISTGIKLPRPVSTIIGAAIAFVIALYGQGSFADLFENYLLLLLYWITPWAAIVLVHWFMIGRHDQTTPPGWTIGATIWCIVTVLTTALFSVTTIYTGPIAKLLDDTDVGYYAGFIIAGLWYWVALRGRKHSIKELQK